MHWLIRYNAGWRECTQDKDHCGSDISNLTIFLYQECFVVSWGCIALFVAFTSLVWKQWEKVSLKHAQWSHKVLKQAINPFILTNGIILCMRPLSLELFPKRSCTPINSDTQVILHWKCMLIHADQKHVLVWLQYNQHLKKKSSQSSWRFSLSIERKIFCSSMEIVVRPCSSPFCCTFPIICVRPVFMAVAEHCSSFRPLACILARRNCAAINPESIGKSHIRRINSTLVWLLWFYTLTSKVQLCCCFSEFVSSFFVQLR